MKLGNKIFNLRKKAGLSQEQLAEILHVTRQTISKWELEETTPDIRQAKELAKVFHVSLDDLTENDTSNILVEKISNTEKLAGIIIKIIKGLGIVLGIIFVIDILSLILFTSVREKTKSSSTESLVLSCTIQNQDYLISIGSDEYFNCSNCNEEMQHLLKNMTDFDDLEYSADNVKTYFEENDGSCIEEKEAN